jgi:hypothetical protein
VRTVLTAALAGAGVAAAMGVALVAASPTAVTSTLPPRATASPPSEPVVLEGRGARPVWAYVVQAPDRSGDRGSAVIDWTPRGRPMCEDGPVPIGRRETELSIVIQSPEPVDGRVLGTIGPDPVDCARAVGTWRGIDGALDGLSGALELTIQDRETVRVELTG